MFQSKPASLLVQSKIHRATQNSTFKFTILCQFHLQIAFQSPSFPRCWRLLRIWWKFQVINFPILHLKDQFCNLLGTLNHFIRPRCSNRSTKDPPRMINTNLIINFKWIPFVRSPLYNPRKALELTIFPAFSVSLTSVLPQIVEQILFFHPTGRPARKLVAIQHERGRKKIVEEEKKNIIANNDETRLQNYVIGNFRRSFYGSKCESMRNPFSFKLFERKNRSRMKFNYEKLPDFGSLFPGVLCEIRKRRLR